MPVQAAVRSTANDLLKFVSANIGLTQSDLTPLMQKTHVIRHRAKSRYGNTALPWMDRSQSDQTGTELLGHAGGTGGYETFIGFDQQHRRGVVVLCSQQGFVASEPLGWLLVERVPLTKPNAAVALPSQSGIAGVGIKLEFEPSSRALLITEVVPNSPASKAHLPNRAIVRKINDVPTASKSELECAGLIRGPAGSKVQLEIVDMERKETTTVELTRENVQFPIVKK